MTLEPSFDAFERAYGSGRVQVVFRRLIDDLETPVSAYLKVAHGQPYSFLFESVQFWLRPTSTALLPAD